MTPEEARKRVHMALKDEGVEVMQVGTCHEQDGEWHVRNWDVQGVTRERAYEIVMKALNGERKT